MFEHPDRYDAVKAFVELPIIQQSEIHLLADAALLRPFIRQAVLFLRKSDAGDLGSAYLRKVKSEPAPPRSDVQNFHPRLDLHLGGEMPLLGELCIFERLVCVFEIGAGILSVTIEEEIIKRTR